MRQVFSRRYAATYATGGSKYCYSEQVPPGYVVHVKTCVAYCSEREASDDVIIGILDAGQEIYLTATATLAAQRGVSVNSDFFLGEGDKAFGYWPDVDDGDILELHINGTLLTLEDFQKGIE